MPSHLVEEAESADENNDTAPMDIVQPQNNDFLCVPNNVAAGVKRQRTESEDADEDAERPIKRQETSAEVTVPESVDNLGQQNNDVPIVPPSLNPGVKRQREEHEDDVDAKRDAKRQELWSYDPTLFNPSPQQPWFGPEPEGLQPTTVNPQEVMREPSPPSHAFSPGTTNDWNHPFDVIANARANAPNPFADIVRTEDAFAPLEYAPGTPFHVPHNRTAPTHGDNGASTAAANMSPVTSTPATTTPARNSRGRPTLDTQAATQANNQGGLPTPPKTSSSSSSPGQQYHPGDARYRDLSHRVPDSPEAQEIVQNVLNISLQNARQLLAMVRITEFDPPQTAAGLDYESQFAELELAFVATWLGVSDAGPPKLRHVTKWPVDGGWLGFELSK